MKKINFLNAVFLSMDKSTGKIENYLLLLKILRTDIFNNSYKYFFFNRFFSTEKYLLNINRLVIYLLFNWINLNDKKLYNIKSEANLTISIFFWRRKNSFVLFNILSYGMLYWILHLSYFTCIILHVWIVFLFWKYHFILSFLKCFYFKRIVVIIALIEYVANCFLLVIWLYITIIWL